MNWIVNAFLLLVIPPVLLGLIRLLKCKINNKKCDSCSWLDICFDVYVQADGSLGLYDPV